MKGNGFQILINLLLLAVLVSGIIFVVRAVDHLRFSVEKLEKSLAKLEEKLAEVPSGKSAAFSSPSRKMEKKTEKKKEGEVPEVANYSYFDRKAAPGGRLITAFASDVGNMNMLITPDAYVSAIWARANDTLAERDYKDSGSGKYLPKMAESWEISEDKCRYRITLRKGILWHDFTDPVTGKVWKNKEVTAHDFKFYIDTVKNPKVDAAPLRSYLADLEKIEIMDDYNFTVVWRKPYFLSEDITLSLSPLPRHLYHAYDGPFDGKKFNDDHKRNRMVVGCGAYYLAKWEKGRRILLKRFENYYGKALGISPALETLSFEIIQHPNTRLQSLLSGDLDMDNLSPDQWINRTKSREFGEKGFLKKYEYPSFAYNYIGLNQTLPVFREKAVRQALSYLVNREKIIKDVFFGLASAVTGPFSSHSSACDKSLPPYPFSPEKAAKLLKDASWRDSDGDGILDKNGEKLKFTVIFPGASTTYRKMLPIIKEDMAKAGIQMDLLGIEWSVLVKRVGEKNFEACALGWTGSLKPDPYQLWHSSQAKLPNSSNMISYQSREADQLIEKIRLSFDGMERTKLYHALHKVIYEDAPYIFLFAPSNLTVLHKRYRNVRVFRDAIARDILWVPRNEQKPVPGV